jgi:hypothetical protein
MISQDTIFVSVPAFNEVDRVVQTITNAIEMADSPENLFFGVVLHESVEMSEIPELPQTKIIRVLFPSGLGSGLTRLMTHTMYNKQKYFLAVDCHTLFARSWDKKLVSQYEEIRQNESLEKAVITHPGIVWWQESDGTVVNYPINGEPDPKMLHGAPQIYKIDKKYVRKDFPETDGDYTLRINHDYSKKYTENLTMSWNFCFGMPEFFMYDIPVQPYSYYKGDQELVALRAWTRGYKFYSINTPIVWSLDKGKDKLLSRYDRHTEVESTPSEYLDLKRNNSWLGIEEGLKYFWGDKFGFYGAPDKESWENYMNRLGYLELINQKKVED